MSDDDSTPSESVLSGHTILDATSGLFMIGEVIAIFLLFITFAIGLVDISRTLLTMVLHDQLGSTAAVISLIDSVLLLFIVVEAKETVVAYVEHESREEVVVVVIFTAIIATVRRIITFHPSGGGAQQVLFVAGGYTVLVVGLGLTYYIVRRAPDV